MTPARRPRLIVAAVALAALGALVAPALAVSDGDYDYNKQGCKANSEDSFQPQHTDQHCYSMALSLSDKTHRYVLVGVPQTPDGTSANAVEICIDLTGTAQCARVDKKGFTPLPNRPGNKINPKSGELHAYFGADDNLDSGEHDGSSQVANGPSDGGGIQANVTPLSASAWLKHVLAPGRKQYLLTHPLPIADFGTGACADGLCISVQTVRRVIYQGTGTGSRDAADYSGKEWDPPSCAGPSDTPADCGGQPLSWWHNKNGTTYAEPGIQIYEDPDPQGSPIGAYPIPALYIGTCGFVAGGGKAPAFPASPITNSAGQLVVKTGC